MIAMLLNPASGTAGIDVAVALHDRFREDIGLNFEVLDLCDGFYALGGEVQDVVTGVPPGERVVFDGDVASATSGFMVNACSWV